MDINDKILINIFIDKEFKCSQIVEPKITKSDLKKRSKHMKKLKKIIN